MLHLLNQSLKIHDEWGIKGLYTHRCIMWDSKLNKVCKPKSCTSILLIVLTMLQHFGKHFSSMIVMLCNCEMSCHAISNICFLRLIHGVQCSWVHSLLMLFYSLMQIRGLFIHLSLDGYLNYLPFWNHTLDCCNTFFCTYVPVNRCQSFSEVYIS